MIQRSVVLAEGMATLRQYKDWLDAQAEALAKQYRERNPNGRLIPLEDQVYRLQKFYDRYLTICERSSFAFRLDGLVPDAGYSAFRVMTDAMHHRMTSEMPGDRKDDATMMDVYWEFLTDLLRDEDASRSPTH